MANSFCFGEYVGPISYFDGPDSLQWDHGNVISNENGDPYRVSVGHTYLIVYLLSNYSRDLILVEYLQTHFRNKAMLHLVSIMDFSMFPVHSNGMEATIKATARGCHLALRLHLANLEIFRIR